ncbi:FUSC family protein [Actinoallomurus rhizosphaericola]|uniref:FUSC family protein n=1 Tax=Actinoallomurus rhizosphaericola TaxID=2952536 RepID=UPI0020926D3C|nr:FUSC family protein [Actinoallomurus rhizosphaericola]MCO5998917.1 FUSC family protein [Actinoallomurus rhizosphaericola]
MKTTDAVRGIVRTYLSREPGTTYDWHIGTAAAIVVGLPACLGVVLDRQADGILTAMAGWLVMRSIPRGDTRDRVLSLVRRSLLMAVGVVLGMLTGGWAALPAVALAAFGAPLRALGPFPALCVVVGAQWSVRSVWLDTALFLAGGLFATALLLIPYFGGRHDPPRPRPLRTPGAVGVRTALVSLRAAAREGGPRFRHAVRLGLSVTAAYILVTATGLPGGQLVIIGIVTTLRPSWGQTTNRIVKRVGGTVLGSLLAAALLAFAAGLSPYVLMAVVALLSGLGQPLRRINYGFWPVFSAPVALLLTDTGGTIGWRDALERSTYNAAGALLAALATLLIWPAHEQQRIPDHLAAVLQAHARLLDRATHLLALPAPPEERLHTRATADDTSRELDQARKRLSLQPRPPRDLLEKLQQVAEDAGELRSAARTAVKRPTLAPPATRDTLTLLAEHLRHTAENLETHLPGDLPAASRSYPPHERIAQAAAKLLDDASAVARLALRKRAPQPETTGR